MTKHTITVKNKVYPYSIDYKGKNTYWVVCDGAGINQPFEKEDLPELLVDLPQWILEKEQSEEKSAVIRFRIGAQEKKVIEKKAYKKGFTSISEYLRSLALQD